MTKVVLLIRQMETHAQTNRSCSTPFLNYKNGYKKDKEIHYIVIMELETNEAFMRRLDKEDGMEEYSLPAGHVLNIAFRMEDLPKSENGQGYAWAESPKPEDYKVCNVPEYDPSVRIAALIKEAEDKVKAAAQALIAYRRQIDEKTCHKHKGVQRQKLELLQDRLNEANGALRHLRDGF